MFWAIFKILTIPKIVLSSSRGQGNFRGLEASRPRPRTSKCVLEDVLEAKDVLEDSTSDRCKCTSHCMGILLYKPSRRGSATSRLLAYCVSADLNFCNVGNKPTSRSKTREEGLDLILANWCAWGRIVGWHVSNVRSFSDHMYIISLY